jgi:subtilisin family serine protease
MVQFLPEPDEPGMMTVIDRDAPGYDKIPARDFRSNYSNRSWRGPTMVVIIALLVFSYPIIESILFGPLIPSSEWAFEDTNIRDLQSEGLDGSDVHICMVDTGIDLSHPALSQVNLSGFLDLVGSNPDGVPTEYGEDFHGTMMAGILVSTGAFTGISTGSTLSVAAALGPTGYSVDDGAVGKAIEWCWKTQRADIISLSLGGEADPRIEIGGPSVTAVEDALEAGVIVVAAAGNQGINSTDVSTPSSIQRVIAVGATDRSGSVWVDSSKGAEEMSGEIRVDPHKKPEVTAPGKDIISTNDPTFSVPYATSSGTSVSTVFVAGTLALILQKHGVIIDEYESKNGELAMIDMIKSSLVESMADNNHDSRGGYGQLNATSWSMKIQISSS